MVTKSVTLSNPVYEVLSQLTGESNTDTALSILLKDLAEITFAEFLKHVEENINK